MPDLLLDLFSEEIPARMQAGAAREMLKSLEVKLAEAGLAYAQAEAFYGPRHLTFSITELPLRQEDRVGSIEPGKPADLIVLRTDTPNLFPVNDPIGAVVWGVDTSNLDWVFVGGRPVMREGVLEADIPGVRNLVTDARQRMGVPTRGLSDALAGGDA